jgi:hypothetical protein
MLRESNYIYVARDTDQRQALVTSVKVRILQKARGFLSRLATISFSKRVLLHRNVYSVIKITSTNFYYTVTI